MCWSCYCHIDVEMTLVHQEVEELLALVNKLRDEASELALKLFEQGGFSTHLDAAEWVEACHLTDTGLFSCCSLMVSVCSPFDALRAVVSLVPKLNEIGLHGLLALHLVAYSRLQWRNNQTLDARYLNAQSERR
eukprot:2448543-Amphidinium_carterae.1